MEHSAAHYFMKSVNFVFGIENQRDLSMKESRYLPVLTVAGSDSSGGAGIQADIKTMSALGCYGMSAITAVTAQNTVGVTAVAGIDPGIVAAQIDAVFDDIRPLAVKTGMLYSSEVVDAVAGSLGRHHAGNLVVDPVMISTSGSRLISADAVEVMVHRLFPLAVLVTPNLQEAVALTGESDPSAQAQWFFSHGVDSVLLKGGDSSDSRSKTDLFFRKYLPPVSLVSPAIDTVNTHGTGCTLSAAIVSFLARGFDLDSAVVAAKEYISAALRSGANYVIGSGHGPVDHFHALRHDI